MPSADHPYQGASIPEQTASRLAAAAWQTREKARVIGNTKVGCAVLDERGEIHTGCNIEHRFRSHDIHAEVSAISAMVATGGQRLIAAFIAAERERFTPCGACLDWIFELGGEDAQVLVQGTREAEPSRYSASQLMPHYPR